MIINLSWLGDYVQSGMDAAQLAKRLTEMLAETVVVQSDTAAVRGVVSARVVSLEPHPEADRLKICGVDWGMGSATVVCGAENVRTDLVSALALPGATIAGGVVVSEEDVRGVKSCGMLVSGAEIGLNDSSMGILEFADETDLGRDVKELVGLDDELIDLDVFPNRPDCMGLIGVAREVAAISGAELIFPDSSVLEGEQNTGDLVRVRIDDPAACPRYVARVVRGTVVRESPPWLKARLLAAGVRSVNNVVDVTNYVMFEYGQPIHAFDYDKLTAREIVVRRARRGEAIVTLDGESRILEGGQLLILDGDVPVALAGVMGGLETEVSEATRNVLIECACFDPVVVRRGAKRLGLRTEASQRFERGVDPEILDRVAARACRLISELGGGEVGRGSVDAFPGKTADRTVDVRLSRARSLLGSDLDANAASSLLTDRGFAVRAKAADDTLSVTVPSFRRDIELEADVIEELARAYGYGRIEPVLPYHQLTVAGDRERVGRSEIREAMVALGFVEVMTSSFAGPAVVARSAAEQAALTAVELANPINKKAPFLRTSVLASLMDAVRRNLSVGEKDLRLFEVGKIYYREGTGPSEQWVLSGVMSGAADRPAWDRSPRIVDFFDGKGMIWSLAEALNIDNPQTSCYHGELLDRGASARLSVGGVDIGSFGMMSAEALSAWDVSGPVFGFELDVAGLLAGRRPAGLFEELPRYPSVGRDVALVVDAETAGGRVLGEISRLDEALVERVEIFDVYQGKQLADGKKSLGFSLTYRSRERTLTDEEVDEVHGRIVDHLLKVFGATLRE